MPSTKDVLQDMVLDGIRVLDFGRYYSCPYAGMLLADMGAEVIRVEPVGGADDRDAGPFAPNGQSLPFTMILSRNKKNITLNIREGEGRVLLHKLAMHVDIVMHNFAPGSPEAQLLSYEALGAVNPRLIVVCISCFGKNGPYAERPGFDTVAQAMSSVMSWTGFPGNPPTRAATAYVDGSVGTYAALGAMFALYKREKTGIGQEIDVAMLDAAVSFAAMVGVAAESKLLGYDREQMGNQSYYNLTDSFEARDGWVVISAFGNKSWRRLIKAMNMPELVDDERFKDDMSRYLNRDVVKPVISKWVRGKSAHEVVEILGQARVPCGKVYSVSDMVDDPQVKEREMLVEVHYDGVGKVPLPGIVPKLSRNPGKVSRASSKLGEDNETIYCGILGYTKEQLRNLRSLGVI